MTRNSELKDRFVTSITLENKKYNTLISSIGIGNFSKWIRDKVDEEVIKIERSQKNVKGPIMINPLNLPNKSDRDNDKYVFTYELFETELDRISGSFIPNFNDLDILTKAVRKSEQFRMNVIKKKAQVINKTIGLPHNKKVIQISH